MPSNDNTTTKFRVDISELKSAMQQAKRQVSIANSEFKAVSSTMDDWSKSSDGISAKLKQLNSNLKNQKSVLSNLEKQYELTVKEMGEGSAAAERLKVSINNQKSVIGNTEKQISKYEKSLEEVSKAEKIASKTGKSVAEVLEELEENAKGAENGFTVLKGAVATFAGNVLTSLVSGLKDAASNLLNLADETREYRTELAKLETVAKDTGTSTDYIVDKWQDVGAVLGEGGEVTEGLNNLMNAGYTTEKEMDAVVKNLEGASIKWSDTLKFEGLSDSLQEWIGSDGANLTGNYAELLERLGYNLEDVQEQTKGFTDEQRRQYAVNILSKSGLDQVSESYRKNNKDLVDANKANAEYNQTLADLGAEVEPVTTALKSGFTGLLQKVLNFVKGADVEGWTEKIKSGFTYLKDNVLPVVVDGFKFLVDAVKKTIEVVDFLSPVLAGLGVALAGLGIAGVIQNFGLLAAKMLTWLTSTKLVTAAQWLLNAAMNANPISLIVIAIAGLVAAFVVLWKKSETFRNFFINLWEKIKEVTSSVIDSIKSKIEGIKKFFTETLPQAFQSFKDWLSSNWENLLLILINPFAGLFKYFYENNPKFKEFVDTAVKFIKQLPSKVWTWLLNAANKVVSWGSSLVTKGREAAQKLLTAVINKVKEIPDKIKSVGRDLVTGLWNGISDRVTWLKNKISGWVGNVTDWLKEFFQIGSPSRLIADEVGRWLPEGLAVGITDNAKSVFTALKDLTAGSLSATRSGLTTATSGTVTRSSVVNGGAVNNFTQIINSPKQLSRLEIYRQSKNLLGFVGGN